MPHAPPPVSFAARLGAVGSKERLGQQDRKIMRCLLYLRVCVALRSDDNVRAWRDVTPATDSHERAILDERTHTDLVTAIRAFLVAFS